MKDLVLYLFLLKLRVTLDSTSSCVNERLGVTKILLKKSLEIYLEYGFYLSPIFMLVLAETDLPTKKKSGK